ncbi:MAG: MgtC/SapB family protein [Nitrospirae bacterium]|nr:MgtC/SapB family protein [Nitrospirota bacterium]
MDLEYTIISAHIIGAVIAGGLIGVERSFHGRPAGFRTHTIVCLASSLLMLVTIYQWKWLPGALLDTVKTDPTRMAQGIMTGIGFLGAGVIYKEGLTVRGLTTAASIWITAAIGILMGIGFYFPTFLATFLTMGILSTFRWIENKMPSQFYAHHYIRFDRNNIMPESELRTMLSQYGFSIAHMSYSIINEGNTFEYSMMIRTTASKNISVLSDALRIIDSVKEYKISPTGD